MTFFDTSESRSNSSADRWRLPPTCCGTASFAPPSSTPGSLLNGLRPDDISITDGRMHARNDPGRGESYQELLRRRGWPNLDSANTYTPDDAKSRYSMHSYGAVFAEVAVDPQLGTVRIRRIYAVYDAGRIINPKLAHSQAIGGMTQGIKEKVARITRSFIRSGI